MNSESSQKNPNTILSLLSIGMMWRILLFVGIFTIGARFIGLGWSSYWSSEGFNVDLALDFEKYNLLSAAYLGMARVWIEVFGDHEASVRLLSALGSIVLMALTYVVASRMYGKTVGLLAVLFLAIFPGDFYHARQAKYYEWHIVTCVILVYALLKFRDERSLSSICWLAIASVLNFLYMPFFAPPAILIFFVTLSGRAGMLNYKRLFIALGIGILLGLGALIAVVQLDLRPYSQYIGLRTNPLAYLPLSFFTEKEPISAFLSTYAIFLAGVIRLPELFGWDAARRTFGIVSLGVFFYALFRFIKQMRREPEFGLNDIFILLWIFLPPLIFIYIHQVLGFYPYAHRYAIAALPATAIMFARGLTLHTKATNNFMISVSVATLIVLSVSSNLTFMYLSKGDLINKWRDVLSEVAPLTRGKSLFLSGNDDVGVTKYYLKRYGVDVENVTVAFQKIHIDEAIKDGRPFETIVVFRERYDLETEFIVMANGVVSDSVVVQRDVIPVMSQSPTFTADIYHYSPKN